MENKTSFTEFYSYIMDVVRTDLDEVHQATLPQSDIDTIVQNGISELWDNLDEMLYNKLNERK